MTTNTETPPKASLYFGKEAVKNTIRKNMRTLCFTLGILFLIPAMPTQAGGINAEEQRLINEASGRFTYEGKTYKAKDSYLELLKEKLSEEDMDLTADEVDQYLTTMYASVQTGLEQGLLEEVTSGEPRKETEAPGIAAGSNQAGNHTQKTADTETPTELEERKSTVSEKAEASVQKTETFSRKQTEAESETVRESESKKKAASEDKTFSETESATVKEEKKASLKGKDPVGKTKETKSSDSREMKNIFLPVLLILLAAAAVFFTVIMLRKRKKQKEFGKLAAETEEITDLHCHILPGVDDGSRDMDMTLKMLDMAYTQGVRRIIATPHYHMGYVQNEPEKLLKVLKEVQEKIKKKYPDLELLPGNEIFYSDGVVDLLKEGKILPLGGENSRYVLLEFSPHDTYSRIQEAVTKLMRAGYRPVIAHVERYQCLHKQKARLEEFQEQGVLFQVNYNSIKKNKWLFQQGFVDLLSTDCHNEEERAPKIQENLKDLNTCCDRTQIERILRETPDLIWNSGKEKER
ncbi:CpsB/CapC family capsule biosynthesis tyrosine phosphatase [Blautia sp. OF03-15BH]|uniref:CpsB/CapC family capsule biosynthesis tyrosine phosphatase n=1 Tax=Blautia sp. OF03-15BH TaxID=2292287 RepID=UPI000E4C3F76|nr:CpsB/CapC family capsule biosynthesis tyrosine phosphatase [Blautia sp. OF03-15BH]